jgi:hypothetical protein
MFVLSLLPAGCRRAKSNAPAAETDSKDLKQTIVVATLDCPLPEHKNAIWCSTFQMAWDKLKQDIIGEPIQILGAEELANRLNQAQFPVGSIEEKSYYAVAGLVKKGIIQQIRKDMARRFPSEPVPTFDDRYTTYPDVMLAYAYLNVDIRFKHPYCTCERGLGFTDSAGVQANVAAFCAHAPGPGRARGIEAIRGQVEVLFYDSDGSSGPAQFAVDLSKQTQPYQVILARMPRCNTLRKAAKTLQDKITASQNDPSYKTWRGLQHGDTLFVPDVLYKLTHHFDELLNKNFGNQKWREYFLFEALQKIDFTLSRTGVILRSEARMKAAPAKAPERRHLHFDRPFLICVQRREPNATPFFLMWVVIRARCRARGNTALSPRRTPARGSGYGAPSVPVMHPQAGSRRNGQRSA